MKNHDNEPGIILEVIESGGYTYLLVETRDQQIWIATSKISLSTGDKVEIPGSAPMRNFYSKSLSRVFKEIYFVAAAGTNINEPAVQKNLPQGHPVIRGRMYEGLAVKIAEGGLTVSEIYAGKLEIAGKEVVVRGKVVKFTPQVLGKNWLHMQDGTGTSLTNDLTVTTDTIVMVGDTVVSRGILAVDKDFGYGYKYEVILENATVIIE
ncbi:MAG: hypothetical protein KKE17_00900 [Proteobacteria bacterium]|nr:hypothetical protein [Pseudomonadota bacterium]MBU1708539.1 hypothetical protein [Pseudomonadota bacterium]